ncbi:MAG: site-2 protease family protein [Planctomycetes bacterium]|nr:site-2 protease family protein [Planctomycetota bacterium]
MHSYRSPLYWSFPCGTWFQTQVRISVFLPLFLLLLCFRLENLQLGLMFGGVFFLSVLLHEFGHVIAARMTGGSGEEILVWPFGGLAFVRPAGTFRSQLLTPMAGPVFNLLLCLICVSPLVLNERTEGLFNLFTFPMSQLSEHLFLDILELIFRANLLLLVVNLIPVYPLDGGQILKAVLSARLNREIATDLYIKSGMIVGLLALIGGLFIDPSSGRFLVFLGAVIMLLNLQESFQLRSTDGYDDSFMGYDFSQGYTSLDRSDEKSLPARRPGLWQRWREQRRAEKFLKEQEQEAEAEQQLDLLLAKVHSEGIESLSDAERRLLDRVSARYRDKDK